MALLDNKVLSMSPGEALLDVPMGDMVQKLAVAIAEAQLTLDLVGVRIACLMSESTVPFKKSDGSVVNRSLLELGFAPTFYHFTETDIEVKLTISMKVEEEFTVDAGASIGQTTSSGKTGTGSTGTGTTGTGTTGTGTTGTGTTATGTTGKSAGTGQDKRVVPFGAAINAEYHRKYEFDMTGSSLIKTKLVSIPAPAVFLEAIKEHARNNVS